MAVALLGSVVGTGVGTTWLVLTLPSPYAAVAVLCGRAGSMLLPALAHCINE